jgi:hypothetical protein
MTDDESPLQRLQAARTACNDGIEAAERGMAEVELLAAWQAGYADRKAYWLMCRDAIDRRIAALPITPTYTGWRRLFNIIRGLL